MPNNRQWATLAWFALLGLWVLSQRDLRQQFAGIARLLFGSKLLFAILTFLGWMAGLIYLASQVGLWSADRGADTAFWGITAGTVLFGRFERVSKEPGFVRRTALSTLELSAFVEVFSELSVLGLGAELLLQPLFLLLGLASVAAAQKEELRSAKRLFDGLILMVSLLLLAHVAMDLAEGWNAVDKNDLWRQFVLPVWLTLGALPFIWVLGLGSAYEQAFIGIRLRSEASRRDRTLARLGLIACFKFRATELGTFSRPWQYRAADAGSLQAVRAVVRAFREERGEERAEAAAKAARLVEFAGVDGEDKEGRRLDRREFEDTKSALRWLGTCQMGWYQNPDWGRYREDLAELVLTGSSVGALPEPHGVVLRVADDGQRWFAWRRTTTGWVFAIGAAGPPPDQWEYDGPEPPGGFPGEDPVWGVGPFDLAVSRNW